MDSFTSYHTDTEAADQTYLPQTRYTDTEPTSLSNNPISLAG